MNYYSGKDLARSFRTVRRNTIQIAGEIPEDQYSHRATPDTRSVLETLQHIAANPTWQHKLHGHDKKTFVAFEDFMTYIGGATQYGATLADKAAVVKALEADGESFASFLDSLGDDALGQMVSFPEPEKNPAKTRFEMLLGVKEHEMHHRGQLMLIQRQLGIVPHLTRARAAR
ncbi:MAG TPA: DinB family protein [Vicinamibacterales bacterium]|nr:DinB family protein [Vicinamibacterales bacterium]